VSGYADDIPAVRRRRPVRPPHVAGDPVSTHNMLVALRKAGFEARVSIVGELTDDRADILVDFPGGKGDGRFLALGARNPHGRMEWRHLWQGNGTRADEPRRQRAYRRHEYRALLTVLVTGLVSPMPNHPGIGPVESAEADGPSP
jgi:hypothetical protein